MANHECDGLVLTCVDFRLWSKFFKRICNLTGLDSFDVLALAGGVKSLVDAETTDTIIKQIKLCRGVHHERTVVLLVHTDCAAYGSLGTRDRLIADLERGRQIIDQNFGQQFRDLKLIKVLATVTEKVSRWKVEYEIIP